jgi:CheY-like chemotaxis protein
MAATRKPHPSGTSLTSERERAVVADDDDDYRALIVAALERDGFEAIEARDGDELVDRVESLHREGKGLVVVSDIGMPHCDGVQAARRLRKISLRLPIVLVTAFTDSTVWRDAYAAGADAVLGKPIEAGVLTRAVRQVMASY